MNDNSHLKVENLSSPTDIQLTPADLEHLAEVVGKDFISPTDITVTKEDFKQLVTTLDADTAVYGVTAGALMEPEPLRDEGPGTPHPITGHKYSSTQVDLPFDIATDVKQLGTELIPDDDLSTEVKDVVGGREMTPHITVKFGIHDNYPDDVEKALEGIPPAKATIGKVMIFESSDEYDVVNLDVISPDLKKLNKVIAESTEVTDTHPTYKPHICLAYVKKGRGAKYDGMETVLAGKEMEFSTVVFSARDGQEYLIPLSEIVHEDKGGAGSGYFGHSGRPGKVGGSSRNGSPKLTKDEIRDIKNDAYYVASEYGQNTHWHINRWLRSGKTRAMTVGDRDSRSLADTLALGFDTEGAHEVTKEQRWLYRGIASDLVYKKLATGLRKGKIISDKAFLSTTRDENIGFLASNQWAEKQILLNIKAPKGTKYFIGRQDEKEWILDRGLKLRVTSFDKNPESIILWTEIVPNRKSEDNNDILWIPLSPPYDDEIKGGEGSGFFGHAGRPGEVGGSSPNGHSSRDSETRLRQVFGKQLTGVSLAGMDKDLSELLLSKLEAFRKENTVAASHIKSIYVRPLPKTKFSEVSGYGNDYQLTFNSHWWGDKSLLSEALLENHSTGWSAFSTVEGLIDHELGHVINLFPGEFSIYANKDFSKKISEYAATNAVEAFAEAYALYRSGGLNAIPEGEIRNEFSRAVNSYIFKAEEKTITCDDIAKPVAYKIESKGALIPLYKQVDHNGMQLWRQPTQPETQIDLKAINDAFDSGESKLRNELIKLKEQLLEDALAGVILLEPADYHSLVVDPEPKTIEALRKEIARLYELGQELVIQELSDQGADVVDSSIIDDEEFLGTLAAATASRMANDVQSRVIATALTLASLGILGSKLIAGIKDAFADYSEVYIDNAAATASHVAINLGRDQAGEINAEIVKEIYYSSVLDQNTCIPCQDADGETTENTESDLPPAPNPECEGRGRCRCIHVFVFKGESKGGRGSGNFGHTGRPGLVGGSAPSGSSHDEYEGLPEEFRVPDLDVTLDGYVGGGLLEEGGFDIARLALKYAWEHDDAGRNTQLNRVEDFFNDDPVTLYHISSSDPSTFAKRDDEAFQSFSSFTYDKDATKSLLQLLGGKGFVYEVSVPKSSIGIVVDYEDQPNRDFWAEQKEVITYKPVSAKNIVNSTEVKSFPDHEGRPGLVGGSLPKEGSSEGIQLFHGTRQELYDAIKKSGLKSNKENRNWHDRYYVGNRESSVFMSYDKDSALGFGHRAVEKHHPDLPTHEIYPLVLKISIPKSHQKNIREDFAREGSVEYLGSIPPEWISVEQEGIATKEDNKTIFAVIICDKQDEAKSFPDHAGRPGEVGGSLPREVAGNYSIRNYEPHDAELNKLSLQFYKDHIDDIEHNIRNFRTRNKSQRAVAFLAAMLKEDIPSQNTMVVTKDGKAVAGLSYDDYLDGSYHVQGMGSLDPRAGFKVFNAMLAKAASENRGLHWISATSAKDFWKRSKLPYTEDHFGDLTFQLSPDDVKTLHSGKKLSGMKSAEDWWPAVDGPFVYIGDETESKGGEGSGFPDHEGRPGLVGGSLPREGNAEEHPGDRYRRIIREGERELKQIIGDKLVNLDGMDETLVPLLVSKMQDFAKDYPYATKKIYGISTSDEMSDADFASVTYHDNYSYTTFQLNKNWWSDSTRLKDALMELEAEGYLVDGTPEGVINHEFGHLIDSPGMVSVYAKRKNANAISEYAAENPAECFAETYALYKAAGLDALPEGPIKTVFSRALESNFQYSIGNRHNV